MTIYEQATQEQRELYQRYLSAICSISPLFSESERPYLDYRIAENLFCRCFNAENVARACVSIDAKIDRWGVGIKTFVDSPYQKVAEFDILRKELTGEPESDMRSIAEFRNKRLDVAMDSYKLEGMSYHFTVRRPYSLSIHECPMDYIDIERLKLLKSKPSGLHFTDKLNDYRFNTSKSTLLEKFDIDHPMYAFGVTFLEDPVDALLGLLDGTETETQSVKETIVLPLYTIEHGEKVVPEKSGLNQWNAGGRTRDYDEVYFAYNKKEREQNENFFPEYLPGSKVYFNVRLPNGEIVQAKRSQGTGKAIMSNPNKAFGKWILRDVLKLKEGELTTYDMLEEIGVNAVVFTKEDDGSYSVDFTYIKGEEEV